MTGEKKLIKIPPLKKKNRSLKDLGANSLAAALHWDRLAGELAAQAPAELPADEEPAPAAPAGDKGQ